MRIDNTQQNSKCRLYGDRDETINQIISECSKLAQKEYKTGHDSVSKVIHWEMGKKFKFDHTDKWYMHNPTSVQENDTRELFWDFDIQTDHLVSPRRPDLVIINKKMRTCQVVDFAGPANHRVKLKERWEEGWGASTLLGNWKNYGTWRWQLYQSWLVLLVQSPKDW